MSFSINSREMEAPYKYASPYFIWPPPLFFIRNGPSMLSKLRLVLHCKVLDYKAFSGHEVMVFSALYCIGLLVDLPRNDLP